MAAESAQPQPDEAPPRQTNETGKERCGPLELLRTSKADGRALLLFSHRSGERRGERT